MPGAPRRGSGGERRERREDRRGGAADKQAAYLEHVVKINRVAKVVKGGRRFSFTALVVVGDGNGMVGVGYGKAKEVPAAIAKGVEEAKKHFFRVPRIATTIPHTVQGEAAAGPVGGTLVRVAFWAAELRSAIMEHRRMIGSRFGNMIAATFLFGDPSNYQQDR